MFNIDLNKLAVRLLPTFLRQSIMVAWAKLLLSELATVNTALQAFVASITRQLSYSSQVILLEAALNNTFPGSSPPIYISDGDAGYKHGFRYLATDGQPNPGTFKYLAEDMMVNPGTFNYLAEDYGGQINFYVNVPSAFTFNENAMTGLVQQYCPADKNFAIRTY